MFLRALLAFLILPGVVAVAAPAFWAWRECHLEPSRPWGLIPLGLGFAALLCCVRDFYVSGKGTLAPWSPPRNLVVVGLYRHSRNPMYVAVVLMLAGWAAAFASWGLLAYAALAFVVFHLRVVYGEEPWLRRTHGAAWLDYSGRVPRWIGWPRRS